MSVALDAIRNKFIVQAQRDGGMTIEEAEALAEFFASVGDSMLERLTPILSDYKTRITEQVRESLIEELVLDIQNTPGVVMTRNTVVTRLRSHKRGGSNQNGTNVVKG